MFPCRSNADSIATANSWIDRENPKVYHIEKPVFMDLDHVAPGNNNPALIRKAHTRDYHFSLYDQPFEQPQNETVAWQVVRVNPLFESYLGVTIMTKWTNPSPEAHNRCATKGFVSPQRGFGSASACIISPVMTIVSRCVTNTYKPRDRTG